MNTEHTNQPKQAAEAAFEQWWQRHGLIDPIDDEDRQYATASSWARRGYLAAMQAQQAEPVARDVIAKLVALTRAVNIALDDSEERDGIDGREHVIGSVNFDAVCDALEALEELPDNKPGWAMNAAGKAAWALRHLTDAAQPPAAAAAVPDGYALVPVVATDRMRAAGRIGIQRGIKFEAELTPSECGLVWAYMVGAAAQKGGA